MAYGPHWAIQVIFDHLGQFGPFWVTLGHFGPLLVILAEKLGLSTWPSKLCQQLFFVTLCLYYELHTV